VIYNRGLIEAGDKVFGRTRERLQLLGIIGELERELESARSLAVDRDQRLAAVLEQAEKAYRILVNECTDAHRISGAENELAHALRIAREENA
jgi:hypothetical protein